jgi:hypothetical protein
MYKDINKENLKNNLFSFYLFLLLDKAFNKGGVSEWVAGFKSSITPLVFKQIFQIFYIK